MCGITGFFSANHSELDKKLEIITNMANSISHRGPDDFGHWVSSSGHLVFGQRRLAIVDLTEAGHQPMVSKSQRFVIVFNGEIYNHLTLRQSLVEAKQDIQWNGHSDTETILAGFEFWGVEETILKLNGMFAIAVWDNKLQELYLIRDRMGEKPLFYGWLGDGATRTFAFASELKAIKEHPEFNNVVCRKALMQYLRFMYVPAPRSIYEGIYKLEPGCFLKINKDGIQAFNANPPKAPLISSSVSVIRWYSLANVINNASKSQYTDSSTAQIDVENCLSRAVEKQLLGDVPIGAFLSGGIDSSLIVALAQKHVSQPIKTFTIGFEDSNFDESPFAAAVASHLKTDHQQFIITSKEAQNVIQSLPHIYDEPFADSSQIPTLLVSKAARTDVTVALSGDAGDELFGGYNRYFWGPQIWNRLSWLPYTLRKILGQIIESVSVSNWDRVYSLITLFSSQISGPAHIGDKAHKLARRLATVKSIDDLYFSLVSEWQDPAQIVLRADSFVSGLSSSLDEPLPISISKDDQLGMMYKDSISYLPDDILCKVDRAAMAVSLETRVPFLDADVIELAWRLPLNMKIRGNQGKWILRQILYQHVPKSLIDRPKAGFAVPIGNWLRGDLRNWAAQLLEPSRMRREGYFHVDEIQQKWQEHLSGQRDNSTCLWAILMFQLWLENNLEGD